MKKMLKAFAVGILSVALLTGCGNNASANTEVENPASTVTNVATADITASEAPTVTDDIVASEAPAETEVNPEFQSTEGVYRVRVTDILGEPVAGVKVQFCCSDECIFGTTDNAGYAEFDQPEGQTYETHILKVPQGYVKDESVYQIPDKYTTVEIKLQGEGDINAVAEKSKTN